MLYESEVTINLLQWLVTFIYIDIYLLLLLFTAQHRMKYWFSQVWRSESPASETKNFKKLRIDAFRLFDLGISFITV